MILSYLAINVYRTKSADIYLQSELQDLYVDYIPFMSACFIFPAGRLPVKSKHCPEPWTLIAF